MTSGILTQAGAQRRRKRRCIDFDFALVDVALFVAVQKFDRVFDGDDVLGAGGVDAIHHGSEGGRLTGAGNAGYQDQAARHVANLLDHLGQIEFVERANLGGNHAEHEADVAALLKHVDAEASQAGDAVGHIDFRGLFEFLLLASGHHAESHIQHVLGGNARLVGEGKQIAINAQVRVVANLQVQVGGAPLRRNSQ